MTAAMVHPSHGLVALASLVEALAYAAVAVPVRRKFQTKGLVVLAVVAAVALSFTVATVEPFVSEFREVRQLPVTGSIVGVIVSSMAIHRFIRKYPEPDPLPEIAFGAGVFLGGFILGIILAGTTVLVIA